MSRLQPPNWTITEPSAFITTARHNAEPARQDVSLATIPLRLLMPVNEEHRWEWAVAVRLGPEQFDDLAAVLVVRQLLAVNAPPPWINSCVLCYGNARCHQKYSENEKNHDPKRGCLPMNGRNRLPRCC
jgi:hypothetical protein